MMKFYTYKLIFVLDLQDEANRHNSALKMNLVPFNNTINSAMVCCSQLNDEAYKILETDTVKHEFLTLPLPSGLQLAIVRVTE